jgi:hypothetical protein
MMLMPILWRNIFVLVALAFLDKKVKDQSGEYFCEFKNTCRLIKEKKVLALKKLPISLIH